ISVVADVACKGRGGVERHRGQQKRAEQAHKSQHRFPLCQWYYFCHVDPPVRLSLACMTFLSFSAAWALSLLFPLRAARFCRAMMRCIDTFGNKERLKISERFA